MKSPENRSFDEHAENALEREIAGCEFLSANDKADIVLLSKGVRRAAIVDVTGFLKDRAEEEYFERNVAHLQRILKNAHLPNDTSRSVDGKFITMSFDIGSDITAITAFRAAEELKGDERIVAEGRLFDYPETAIEGFVQNKKKDNKTLPEELRASDAMAFLNYRLSEDHWADEWKAVEARAEQIRMHAPEIYRVEIEKIKRNRG